MTEEMRRELFDYLHDNLHIEVEKESQYLDNNGYTRFRLVLEGVCISEDLSYD